MLEKPSSQFRPQKLRQDGGTLAHRLNRAMPASTNFPEDDQRLKTSMEAKLETSTKFSIAQAFNALQGSVGPDNDHLSNDTKALQSGRNPPLSNIMTQQAKPQTAMAMQS